MSMKQPLKKQAVRLVFTVLASVTVLALSLPADTHTWTGATSANWSVSTNWNEGTAPAPGESNVILVFPQGAANQTNTNDIVGLVVDSISITTAASYSIYSISGNGITLNSSLTFSNPGSGGYYPHWYIPLTLGGSVTIASSGRQSKLNGTIDLNGQALAFDCTGDLDAEGVISGTGSITKNMSGPLTLTAANTYSGPTSVYGGSIYIHHGSALGESGSGTTFYSSSSFGLSQGPFTSAEPITFAGGREVYAYGQNTLSGAIILNNDVDLHSANASDQLTISGPISGTGGIIKSSSGTLVLSGTGTYLGTTEINDGDLSVTGSITSNVTIDGATARLTGGGSVGSISFGSSGGTVYPSIDGIPDTLTSNGGFSGTADATFLVGMDATQASRLAVNGTVSLGGAALTIDLQGGHSPPFGHVFRIIRNDGTDPATGTFNGLAEGALHKAGGLDFGITYVGGNGNEINVMVPLRRHAVGNFDGDSAEEAAVDFGTAGVWILNAGVWTQLTPNNPESLIAADLQNDGDDEIIVDMADLGLWVWDGGAWANLTTYNPEGLLAGDVDGDNQAEILADLGATGLWKWDSGTWVVMSSSNPESMACADIDGDLIAEVPADFGPTGLWVWNAGFWSQLSAVDADFVISADLNAGGNEDMIVDFGPVGLWSWVSAVWSQLSAVNADHVAASPVIGYTDEEVIGDFGSLGLWLYDGAWTQLSSSNADFMAGLDVDGSTGADILGDFGSLGLWRWDGSTWTALSLENPDFLFGGDLDGDAKEEMLADFGTLGLWLYDEGAWTQVSASDPQ